MTYAYDTAVPLPMLDLYDKDIMAMSINAAKYMYDKGLKQIEDFYDKYGDFISPIQKDMDWYAQNVTGKANNFINQLYANGIDPLRSAEGRAAVAQLVRSMPIGDIAKLRQSAETAKEYLKSIDDNTNPELEKFLGRDLSTWSTLGDPSTGDKGNGVWGASNAAKYQDLNQYTSHIFDGIKDSYIGTDKDHYDWYGVTEDMLAQSLTPDTLGGLLNTDLGRFHYQNAIKDLIAQGITNPTDAQAMAQFRHNVIAANHKKIHQDKKLNELWKLQEENRSRMRAAAASRAPQLSQNPQWSFMEQIRRGAVTSITGEQSQQYGLQSLDKVRDIQIENGKAISKQFGNNSWRRGAVKQFVDIYTKSEYDPSTMARFVSEGPGGTLRFEYGEAPGSIRVTPKDFHRLHSEDDIVSHTTGFRGTKKKTNYSVFNKDDGEKPAFVEVTFTGKDYGALMKSDRNENHFQAVVRAAYPTKVDNKGVQLYEYKVIPGAETMYFDSHITSMKNAPGTGSLGIHTSKGVKPKKGMSITNAHDSRYQDAQLSDKIISDDIVAKTVYGADATLPEMLNWPIVQ